MTDRNRVQGQSKRNKWIGTEGPGQKDSDRDTGTGTGTRIK